MSLVLPSNLILFDGVCNLCNGAVQWVINRDKTAKFHFASLQSATGQALLKSFDLPITEFESFIYIKDARSCQKSDAVLEVLKELGGFWTILYVFILIPRPVRDALYHWVAKSRYKWFGRSDSCMIPTPELKARFLDSI